MSADRPATLTLDLPDADATARLGACLAPVLRAGDTLLLSGEIGAGKTHFARAIISARLAAAGASEDVPSPTFTIVQTYEADGAEIWHADLYRLSGTSEVWELGLEEAFDNAICLVEWPDRLGAITSMAGLRLEFVVKPDDGRTLTAMAIGPRGQDLLKRMAACVPGARDD